MQDKCTPADHWNTEEKSCQQFTLRKCEPLSFWLDTDYIMWKGVRKQNDTEGVADPSNGEMEDISPYDNNSFLWYCSKDETPAALQQATVLLDPPPGNISISISTLIDVNVTLTNSFPVATSELYAQNGKRQDWSLDSIGIINNTSVHTRIYEIRLKARETFFTILVDQSGFRNKTFEYRVTNTDQWRWSGGQNRFGDYFFLTFTLFMTM